jgi:DNA-binding transcriptional LysR family regulator
MLGDTTEVQLRSFIEVAERRSVTEAARVLGYSQPTVSGHLRSLERRIGAKLFERSKCGMCLTHEGQRLLGVAKWACRQYEELDHHLRCVCSER